LFPLGCIVDLAVTISFNIILAVLLTLPSKLFVARIGSGFFDHPVSITYDYIDDYLYRIAAPRDPLLEKMEEYADSNAVPIIGPLVGRLLYNLAKTSQS